MDQMNPYAVLWQSQQDFIDSVVFLGNFLSILFNGGERMKKNLSKSYEKRECEESRT